MSQTIILSLKKRSKIIIKTHEKAKIMFKTHFLFSLMIFTNNIEKFFYLLLANDKETMTNQKLMRVVYKINLNNISKINKVINRIIKQLIVIITT